MGMYTELVMAAELREDVPKQVVEELQYMLYGEGNFADRTPRWRTMLRTDSYYFPGDTRSTLRYDDISRSWYLTIRCNLKNYDDDIVVFLDWIGPYLNEDTGAESGFMGYVRYEEDDMPSLLFLQEGVVTSRRA